MQNLNYKIQSRICLDQEMKIEIKLREKSEELIPKG